MATINGLPVNFAFIGTADSNQNIGLTTASISGIILQDADQTDDAAMEMTRRGDGEEAIHAHYGFKKTATLTYVVGGSNIAAAKTNTALPAIGTFVNITVCAEMPSLVHTNWEVMKGSKISKSNTTNAKITLNLEYNANITAVAS